MSSQQQDSESNVLSENVVELLNGEICDIDSKAPEFVDDYTSSRKTSFDKKHSSSRRESRSSAGSSSEASADRNGISSSFDEENCSKELVNKSNNANEVSHSSANLKVGVMVNMEIEELKKLISDKDLQLQTAAEYGITLVNKSQELEIQLEKEREQLKMKLEEASNEKHQLRRQLESQTAEHEMVVLDLRSDLASLKRSLEDERKNAKMVEKEYQEKIQELSTCNEVLSEQILSASIHEEEARNQVSNLRLQVSECETEQYDQVETLQNELTDLRNEMERMIKLKADECKILSVHLDSAQERLKILEKEKAAESSRAQHLQEELLQLEDKYVLLLSKIESTVQSPGSFGMSNPNEMSLFAELDVLSDAASTFDILSGRQVSNGKSIIGTQLRQEILEVYRQVQRLIMEVKGQGNLWSPEVVDIADLKAGQLLLALSELQDLMSRRFGTTTLPPLNDERTRLESQLSYLREQCNSLRDQLGTNQATLDMVKAELASRDAQLRRSSEEKAELEKMVAELRQEVINLHRSLDDWREMKVGISEAEVVQEYKRERDEAIKSQHDLRDQFVQLKLDLGAIDRQLIESVEQKLQLSNQLEAWQNDMHDLIETKMAGEIARDSLKGQKRSKTTTHVPPRPSYLKKFSLKWS